MRVLIVESLTARLPVENPHDEFGRLAGVFNDTLSRLHAAFEQLRRFTADASHELRTPLTAMRSVGEVALQRSLNAAGYRDVIGSMLEEVDRLTRLVENLLTLTRAESGRIPLTRDLVDLGELAASVADNLRVLAEEKEQSLWVDTGAHVTASCDPAVVRLGLINLLHNAIKYTPGKGAVPVRVAATPSGEAAIEVKDSGPGLPAVHRERIFERFLATLRGCINSLSPTTILPTTTLASRTSRSAPAGTPSSSVTLFGSAAAIEGLDLAVEPHSVRQLPSTPLAPHSARDALCGSHILVVDDDPDIRTLVNKALSQDGHIVIEASGGQEALALIDAQAPDFLVLDLLMPEQGGLEVLKVLRSRPATAALPVLVLTALDDEVNTRAGFDLGATDYLTKPFSIPQLAPRMRNFLIPPGFVVGGMQV